MRLFNSSLRLPLAAPVALAALSLFALPAPKAHAQGTLSFSGGSGTPLTVTLASPVTYTLTAAANRLVFVFAGEGNNFPGGTLASGSITYSINGGAPQTNNLLQTNVTAGVVTPNDLLIYGNVVPGSASNTVVLSGGSLTTSGPFAGAAPAGGTFTTFIIDNSGNRVSPNGVSAGAAAPEPGTLSLVGMGLVSGLGTLGFARKRKKATQTAA